jgi:DNA-directed RNA polymerase subunit RPC12/RpoP
MKVNQNSNYLTAVSELYKGIEELEETNTPPALINRLMDSVQKLAVKFEEIIAKEDSVAVASTSTTEERLDLSCPHCGEKVFDNRVRKSDPAQPSFTERSPDFICSNDINCPAMIQGKTRLLRASWYLRDLNGNPKDLPKEWNI